MAVKYAIASGNWNNTAVWNGGTLPQNGDEIYLNGYTITCNINVSLPNSTISSEANTELNINGGGVLDANHSASILRFRVKSIYIGSGSYFFYRFLTNTIFTGDFYLNGTNTAIYKAGSNIGYSWTINGNVYINNNTASLFNDDTFTSPTLTVNGNVISNVGNNAKLCRAATNLIINGNLIYCGSLGSVTTTRINGNFTIKNANISLTNVYVSGNILMSFARANISTLYFGGTKIQYENNNNHFGVSASSLVFNNDNEDTFIWQDITEPRTNPFIIVTNYEINNTTNYPAETDVKKDVPYAYGQLVGTFEPNYPPESVVLDGFEYGENMTGTMTQSVQVGCVTKEDVREGVPLIGMYEDGQQVVGTIVIPAEEDVREGVHYDNNKIGTLIVQGGGDRLRIADFGYYTNAQSDTYIVDITEADKPKFASAEERILIEMFPTLDLDNIPQMYFDDLFVKYLKYRLIVEYYRTAGVNSTFTPSEPTTEIVNYRNVTCEVWLNSANTYLNAWNKKFGLNKPPQKIRL